MTIESLAQLLGTCARERRAVAIQGGNTLRGMGLPPLRADVTLSTLELNEIVEDAPDDLTIAVQSGVTLRTLATRLAKHGTHVPLDAPRGADATVGGTLAAGWLGPRRHYYGRPRDFVIGSIAVLADGTITHAGGMVVKNVSGYDLSRLYVGSFGALAVLAQINLKTIAASPPPACFTFACPRDARTRAGAVAHLAVAPSAAFGSKAVAERSTATTATRGAVGSAREARRQCSNAPNAPISSAMGETSVPETRIVDTGAHESFERMVDSYVGCLGDARFRAPNPSVSRRRAAASGRVQGARRALRVAHRRHYRCDERRFAFA